MTFTKPWINNHLEKAMFELRASSSPHPITAQHSSIKPSSSLHSSSSSSSVTSCAGQMCVCKFKKSLNDAHTHAHKKQEYPWLQLSLQPVEVTLCFNSLSWILRTETTRLHLRSHKEVVTQERAGGARRWRINGSILLLRGPNTPSTRMKVYSAHLHPLQPSERLTLCIYDPLTLTLVSICR